MYIYVFLFLDPNEDFLTELKLWAVQNNILLNKWKRRLYRNKERDCDI